MITSVEYDFIMDHAYIPEHVVDYGAVAAGDAEPFLFSNFVGYMAEGHLIFVGYPLKETMSERHITKALDKMTGRLNPHTVTVLGASPAPPHTGDEKEKLDSYYRLEIAGLRLSPKVRNMIKRAEREVSLEKGKAYGGEHEQLVSELICRRAPGDAACAVFSRLPRYLAASSTAFMLEARDSSDELVAFDVAEFGGKDYAFYMFNFASRRRYVPGCSDLLFAAIVEQAEQGGKRYVNLGLGIDEGVAFFKEKWGAKPFLAHRFFTYERKREIPENMRILQYAITGVAR